MIEENATGIGYKMNDLDKLEKILIYISKNSQIINDMKKICLKKAENFSTKQIVNKLILH